MSAVCSAAPSHPRALLSFECFATRTGGRSGRIVARMRFLCVILMVR
jgi:hypothetical protein